MYWILSYVIPASVLYFSRPFIKNESHQVLYTHLFLLCSIGLSWCFVEAFNWGITSVSLIVLGLASLFLILILKSGGYVISVIIQELCILLAVSIAPLYAIPVILILYSVLHPTLWVRIGTIFLGAASIWLYLTFESIMWSIILHLCVGTGLFVFRSKAKGR